MKRSLIAAAILFSVFGTSAALAGDKCHAPKAEWQPTEALQQKLEGEGWKVEKVKTRKGCYTVAGTNAEGASVAASFDPKTFEMIEEKAKKAK